METAPGPVAAPRASATSGIKTLLDVFVVGAVVAGLLHVNNQMLVMKHQVRELAVAVKQMRRAATPLHQRGATRHRNDDDDDAVIVEDNEEATLEVTPVSLAPAPASDEPPDEDDCSDEEEPVHQIMPPPTTRRARGGR